MRQPPPPDVTRPTASTSLATHEDARAPINAEDAHASINAEDAHASMPTWARLLTRVLDDLIRIPGTEQGVGLDALLGLFPGVGDTVTGLGSMALLLLALRQRVPTVILVKMLGNIGVDVLTGTVPVLGDVFDVFFRSNRRNLELIEQHAHGKAEPSTGDYVLVGGGLLLAAAAVATPFVISAVLGFSLIRLLTGS